MNCFNRGFCIVKNFAFGGDDFSFDFANRCSVFILCTLLYFWLVFVITTVVIRAYLVLRHVARFMSV